MSLDRDGETHNHIRGKGVFAKIRQNISSGIPADCYCNTTLTRLNHAKIQSIVEASKEPGSERNMFCMVYSYESKGCVISVACRTPERYRRNTKAEASLLWGLHRKLGQGGDLMRTNQWSKRCPTWFVESYDAYGNRKPTCVFGEATSFMCENCGCNIYPSILTILERRKGALISKLAFGTSRHIPKLLACQNLLIYS